LFQIKLERQPRPAGDGLGQLSQQVGRALITNGRSSSSRVRISASAPQPPQLF
jgi:hypothetical protein